jgi:hypothetical protein
LAQLTATGRKHIARKNFAYVDSRGGEHLPIHDEEHVRNAIARFNQTAFDSVAAKGKARRRILAAAKRHGIEVAKDDGIAKRPTSARRKTAARRGVKKAGATRRRS